MPAHSSEVRERLPRLRDGLVEVAPGIVRRITRDGYDYCVRCDLHRWASGWVPQRWLVGPCELCEADEIAGRERYHVLTTR